MKMIDSIQSVFDRKSASCKCSACNWVVEENDSGAIFKKLTIQKQDTEFEIIDNELYQGLSAITSDRSTFLADKDCDGVSFYEKDGIRHIIFVDLKSSFKKGNITKAFKQDFYTLLKLHMMLSLCEGYQIQSLKIACYVACPPCKTEDEITSIKDNLLMEEELDCNKFINKCLAAYFFNKKSFSCQIKDIPYVNGKRLHEDILTKDINFCIYTTENPDDSEGILQL